MELENYHFPKALGVLMSKMDDFLVSARSYKRGSSPLFFCLNSSQSFFSRSRASLAHSSSLNCVGVRSQFRKAKLDITYLPNAIVASLTNKIATRSVTVQLISKSVIANHPHLAPERCFIEACTPTRYLINRMREIILTTSEVKGVR